MEGHFVAVDKLSENEKLARNLARFGRMISVKHDLELRSDLLLEDGPAHINFALYFVDGDEAGTLSSETDRESAIKTADALNKQMRKILKSYGIAMPPPSESLVYFSGHEISVNVQPFLDNPKIFEKIVPQLETRGAFKKAVKVVAGLASAGFVGDGARRLANLNGEMNEYREKVNAYDKEREADREAYAEYEKKWQERFKGGKGEFPEAPEKRSPLQGYPEYPSSGIPLAVGGSEIVAGGVTGVCLALDALTDPKLGKRDWSSFVKDAVEQLDQRSRGK